MKVIKKILFPLLTVLFFFSCQKEEQITFNESIGEFVRFHLQVNSNNEIIEAPLIENNKEPVSEYEKDNYQVLKIPVALTASIENTRWDASLSPEIKFILTEVSDPSIDIGFPNEEVPNDELTIKFSDVVTNYNLNSSQEEIIGNKGEQIIIDINFPEGFVASEIENTELLQLASSNFRYSLVQLPIQNNTLISYQLTVEEDISDSLQELTTVFSLASLDNYELIGTDIITIKKSNTNSSDNSIFTASNFYNLSNPFYRTYGENWLYNEGDEQCEWQSFTTFTTPVEVDKNHPNAVLFSGGETEDTTDDVYHHAFRIGFTSATTITTNPFNLKRWVNNESVSISRSPGFQIDEALEFFPDNGTSETSGIVEVVKQDLLITNLNEEPYIISISGSGTYQLLDSGVFEISLVFEAYNEELWGGSQVGYYKIYNSISYSEPTEIPNSDCIIPVDL